MSESKRKKSPYEQGELKSSPERHTKKKKSKKSKKMPLPPDAKLHVGSADDDDDVQIMRNKLKVSKDIKQRTVQLISEAVDHGEEEGGSLTIKPPQLQAMKHKDKGHKHKRDKRGHENSSSKERARLDRSGERDKHRDKLDLSRDFRDAREIVRERKKERELKEKEIAREMREREARRESNKERERLEKIELERRRERILREEQAKEKALRHKVRKDDRRQIGDNSRRDREKLKLEDRLSDEHHRSRSRDHEKTLSEKTRYFPPPPRLHEDKNSKKESSKSSLTLTGSGSKSSLRLDEKHPEAEQDTRMVVVEDDSTDKFYKPKEKERPDETEVMSRQPESDPLEARVKDHEEEEEAEEEEGEEEEDGEDDEEEESDESDSDSDDSSSDSSSDEEDSSNEEDTSKDHNTSGEKAANTSKEDEEEEEDEDEKASGKLRSKFDDHSDVESHGHSTDHSPADHYVPESPEMSDVEAKPEDSLPLYLPAIQGCRSVEEFNCLNRIEEGTYGVVYRALDKKTDEIVALKRLKMEKEKEGFPITSLREINTLLKAQHENIVTVREIVVGSNMDKIYIVMDFVEHDLKSLMENMKNPFLVGEVKTLLKQLLRAVRHLHDNWILHRDLKTSNLLLSHKGILKVGDFGLAREYGSPLKAYTPIVVTLWYRAPELLLGCKEYTTHIDMWSVGCIFAELLLMKALWPGKSEIDQINKIFKDLGTPTEKIWPGVTELPGMKKVQFNENPYNSVRNRFGPYLTDLGFDLMNRFFAYDPAKRITAEEGLEHEYFRESPLPVDPSMFPTWPARSEQTRKHSNSPKPPSGGKAYQNMMDDEENFAAGGFHMPSAARGASAQGMGFSLKF
ncbi:cyclin-dependent kinase 11B-like isoform X1 [Biomphalaria glabrata]|uniref:cyclin-dependent kinase n=1 Tax=Biomphalaria glabrata TaxID=6526 RepID=A0A9W2YN28_BIOGL|nr:cyclin-dependent kinase 11B-like isoform X1 [Biomphalaria glabrata]